MRKPNLSKLVFESLKHAAQELCVLNEKKEPQDNQLYKAIQYLHALCIWYAENHQPDVMVTETSEGEKNLAVALQDGEPVAA